MEDSASDESNSLSVLRGGGGGSMNLFAFREKFSRRGRWCSSAGKNWSSFWDTFSSLSEVRDAMDGGRYVRLLFPVK